MQRLVVLLVAACSEVVAPERPAPLAALPPPAPVSTDRFLDAESCAQCHLAPDSVPALHDATGANVSPVLLWRSSLMAFAARDPYYLSVFAEELARAPSRRATIEPLCTRCHAPAGSEERDQLGQHLGFDDLVAGDDASARLARGGVTCTACHQIDPANVGDESSFSGGFVIGYDRKIYGPYVDPSTSPMHLIVNYTPTYGNHIGSSALCATCHTVIVPTSSGSVVEQATFLEWRSSSLRDTKPCQLCHVPTTDTAGAAIATPVATYPAMLGARTPVGRHVFVGGNAYMLALLADAVEWSGAGVAADELVAAAARDRDHLATAARVTIASATRTGTTLTVVAHVENLTGHKLPTGYPSRRMWLHATATTGGQIVFESGRTDATGALVDATGMLLPTQPHRDTIAASDEVQVWESVLVDRQGVPTHRALDGARYSKDDRILPAGFAPSVTDKPRTAVVGVVADASFVAGSDEVTFQIANAPADITVSLDLCFQAVRPETVDAIDASATPAGTRFVDLARSRPDAPVIMAHAEQTVP